MNSSLADQLRQLVGMQPSKALGGGMAGQAGDQLAGRNYQLYVQEARAMGQQPISPQAWMQTQGK